VVTISQLIGGPLAAGANGTTAGRTAVVAGDPAEVICDMLIGRVGGGHVMTTSAERRITLPVRLP